MTDLARRARSTPVSMAEGLLAIPVLLVGRETPIADVLRLVSEQPQTRVIGVVDENGILIGVLPILRLAEAYLSHVSPEVLMSEISTMAGVQDFGRKIEARTAGDAMLAPVSLTARETVDQAFRLMHRRHISGAYVVDETGRPTGYLDLLELVALFLPPPDPSGASHPRHPSDRGASADRPVRPDGDLAT
jgi:CBS domain-containing protein